MGTDEKKAGMAAFERLKANRHVANERIRKAMLVEAGERLFKGSHLNKRIKKALAGTSDGARMAACLDKTGSQCGSVWCARCRDQKQKWMVRTFGERISDEGMTEKQARERLRLITVLHEVVSIEQEIDEDGNETGAYVLDMALKSICEAASDMKLAIRNLKRKVERAGYQIWMRGGTHLELVNTDLLLFQEVGNRKAKVLCDWIDTKLDSGKYYDKRASRAIVVHFHALVDLNGMDDEKLKKLCKEKWNDTEHQVHMQATWTKIKFRYGWKEQTVDDALTGIGRYCFNGSNHELRFQEFWGAGKVIFEEDTEIDANGDVVTFAKEVAVRPPGEMLNADDIKLLVLAHNAVAGPSNRGLTVGIY